MCAPFKALMRPATEVSRLIDDRVFVGSFNLSRSGERNAENMLEIEDAAIAERLAGFVDEVRARYPRVELTTPAPVIPTRSSPAAST